MIAYVHFIRRDIAMANHIDISRYGQTPDDIEIIAISITALKRSRAAADRSARRLTSYDLVNFLIVYKSFNNF